MANCTGGGGTSVSRHFRHDEAFKSVTIETAFHWKLNDPNSRLLCLSFQLPAIERPSKESEAVDDFRCNDSLDRSSNNYQSSSSTVRETVPAAVHSLTYFKQTNYPDQLP
jgi:hypothetical protein